MTNGACGSRPHSGHGPDRDDTIRDVRFLDSPERRGDGHMYYYHSGLKGIIIIIVIILNGGVIGDIFRMSLRNQNHPHLAER